MPMELWKFGDIKNYTSLRLLTAIFDFPSPKDDMDGSDVASVYWEDRDLDRIASYCEKDVLATVQLFLKIEASFPFCTVTRSSLCVNGVNQNTNMRKHIVAPSVLAADFTRLGEEIEMVNQSEADWLH